MLDNLISPKYVWHVPTGNRLRAAMGYKALLWTSIGSYGALRQRKRGSAGLLYAYYEARYRYRDLSERIVFSRAPQKGRNSYFLFSLILGDDLYKVLKVLTKSV
ncbi:hypothetical protein ZIOFF_026111 [Zingiber officinale]|uniref:Uncharacterized protein n=1 Tax=Zingiber officinale TaxID=94328 RepID=A0A8J5GYM9_ZINOF|nr:hypothetical protein ZIOFF_026111 [Zingiber officinale]